MFDKAIAAGVSRARAPDPAHRHDRRSPLVLTKGDAVTAVACVRETVPEARRETHHASVGALRVCGPVCAVGVSALRIRAS